MSNQADFNALPDRAVERLFARFAAMYGDQAMRRMWGQQSVDAVKAIWAEALGRFTVEQLKQGIRNLEEDGNTFPPTLPEFVAACRRKPPPRAPEHRRMLPVPDRSVDQIAAGAIQTRVLRALVGDKRGDPKAWARRIVERAERGDGKVPPMVLAIARDALDEASA